MIERRTRCVTIVGARPQFIKMPPVSRALASWCDETVVHTGQHYDDGLSGVFWRELGLGTPAYNLGVGSGSASYQTSRMLAALEPILVELRPAFVLVYGDTNSTLAGALCAAQLVLPLVHVESGLRSGDRGMPEEVNRVVTDHLAEVLFCPNQSSAKQLESEGIVYGVHVVGDVMHDQLLETLAGVPFGSLAIPIRERAGILGRPFVLLTLHRPSNTDLAERLSTICEAIRATGMDVLFPVHPRTAAALAKYDIKLPERTATFPPVAHAELLDLIRASAAVVTDSGGVQREAYLLYKPCVTLRDRTEWPETIAAGWNVLGGASADEMANAIKDAFLPPKEHPPLFGDGRAGERISETLQARFARPRI